MTAKNKAIRKAARSGIAYGALATVVSAGVQSALFEKPLLSQENAVTFLIMTAATTAGTWYGISSSKDA